MSNNMIVMDLETQKSFKEVGRKLEKLKISVAGIYDYATDKYTAYEEKDLIKLDQRLQQVELIIGFNIRRFDMPVLAPYVFKPIESYAVLDLLDGVEKVRGHRASLDSIAGPTLNRRKIGSGMDAIQLFREGRREELHRYCLEDVRLTREVYEYGCREGKVLFTSTWDYKTYEIPVTWKQDTEDLMHQSASAENNFPTSLF